MTDMTREQRRDDTCECGHHVASHANYGTDNPDSRCMVTREECKCQKFVPRKVIGR